MAVERLVGGGLVSKDIETGSADLAAVERLKQRVFIDVGAAGGVDDDDAVLHLGDVVPGDESAAVDSGSVDGDEVGLAEQFIHFHIGDAELLFDAGDMEDIEGDDVHADALGKLTELLTDAAEADDTEGLAAELHALGVSLLLPLAFAHGGAGDGDAACAGEHVRHGELGNGLGRGFRGVLDLNAVFLGISDVNVVQTHAGTNDALELAALGFVDLSLAELGLGADDGYVEVAQSLAELFGLIKLLNDLMTHGANLLDRALIHTVSNENTHDINLLKSYFEKQRAAFRVWLQRCRSPLRAEKAFLQTDTPSSETVSASLRRARRKRCETKRGIRSPFSGYLTCVQPRTF